MKANRYPDYIGVSEVTTQSFEHMRVEAKFEGQPSIMFDEPKGFDIGDPPDLQLHHPGAMEFAPFSEGEQFVVGNTAPEEEG